MNSNQLVATQYAIIAEHLNAVHSDGTSAFRDICVKIKAQETVALVGPNGAGKTSFFLAINGILSCGSGLLRVFDLDPFDYQQRSLLPGILGLVMQQSDDQLFNPTVLDDVAFGPLNLGWGKEDVRFRVTEALEKVKLTGYEDRVPHRLSGGEKRRVALAGILAMKPQFLLLDEPTQDLDPVSRRELVEIVQELPQGKAIASHDLDFILNTCPRTIIFNRTIIADGKTEALLADADLMEANGLEVPYRLR